MGTMSEEVGEQSGSNDGIESVELRRAVRERYAAIAGDSDDGTSDQPQSCCADSETVDPDLDRLSRLLGYSEEESDSVAAGANLGLGCGNPTAIANLQPGQTVLDLGSGAGFDAFLAANEVGDSGRVIGVDMTPEMVEKARKNAINNDASNVEFRLGEIEHLPVADESVNVVISNCVVNLSPDKQQVFEEAYRVLRPGGRLAISDVVRSAPLPAELRADPDAVASCVGGASDIETLEDHLHSARFHEVGIEPKSESEEFIREWDDSRDLSEYIRSAQITGRKPAMEPS